MKSVPKRGSVGSLHPQELADRNAWSRRYRVMVLTSSPLSRLLQEAKELCFNSLFGSALACVHLRLKLPSSVNDKLKLIGQSIGNWQLEIGTV